MMRINRQRRRGGQELVEFSLVVTLLILLTMGLIQFGIVLNAGITLSHVARAGARHCAVYPSLPDDDLKTYIVQNFASPSQVANLTTSDITITPAAGSRTSGGSITVALSYNLGQKIFVPTFPGVANFLRTYTVSATAISE